METFEELISVSAKNVEVALTTVDASGLMPRFRKRNWRQFHPPSHLNYPTRNSLQKFFKARGFEVIVHKHFGMYRPFAEYLAVFFKSKNISSSPWPSLYQLPIYLNLFEMQFILVRRTAVTHGQ